MKTALRLLLAPPIDSDVIGWKSRVIAAGGTVSSGTVLALSRFSKACKAAGLWGKLNRVNLFCGDQLTAALVPLKVGAGSATDTNVNFVSGDYTEATGITGNGSSKYLNTGFNPSTSGSLTSFSLFCYTSGTGSPGTTSILAGNQNAGANLTLVAWASTGTAEIGAIGAGSSAEYAPAGTPSAKVGFLGIVSNGSRGQQYYHNGAAVSSAVVSSGSFYNGSIYVCATNSAGSPGGYSSRPIRGYSIGTGLTASEVAAYNTIMEAFQDALGRGVQP